MDVIKNLWDKIAARNADSSIRIKLIIAVGAAAMLLLALPDMCGGCTASNPETVQTEVSAEQYADELEKRLEDMISAVEGAGKTKVMITLQNGKEYIYASEDKLSVNTSESTGTNGNQSSEAKENSENSYIIIDTDEGEKALIRTELMPSVNGVVVACEGAGDPNVSERVEQVVTTALNISSKRVCITLLSTDQ